MFNKIKGLISAARLPAGLFAVLILAGCASAPNRPLDMQALGNAVALDDARYVRSLVDARMITVDQVVPGIGYAVTPMVTVAARNGSVNVLRYLIAAKADLNARTPDRDTPVMLAAMFSDEDRERNSVSTLRYDQSVRLLVEAGASVENTDANAYTALAYAAYASREGMISYLLQKGAKPNGNAQGRVAFVNTPLMMATMQGNRDITLQLLRAGADAAIRVQNGMTALEFARKHKHGHLEKVLVCAESLKSGETFRQRCE